MAKITARFAISVLVVLMTGVLVYGLQYDSKQDLDSVSNAVSDFPLNIGRWKGKDNELEEYVYDILETRNIINRSYVTGDGEYVFLSVVYYTKTKVDFHAPEACLGGQGGKVTKTVVDVPFLYDNRNFVMGVNQLIREDSTGDSLVYYFYKAGDYMGKSYISLRINLSLNRYLSSSKSGSLVRISTPLHDENIDRKKALLKDFLEDIYPHLIEYL